MNNKTKEIYQALNENKQLLDFMRQVIDADLTAQQLHELTSRLQDLADK